MNSRHLTDDQLAELCLARPARVPAGEREHLATCTSCEMRRAAVAQILTDVSDAVTAEVDELFPPDRLARQQARILQRVEQDGRPGRLIAFPAALTPGPSLLRRHPTTRWIAAAAAAAFIMGLLAGHLAHDLPGERSARVTQAPRPTGTALRTVPVPVSDEEFLGELEIAVGSAGPAALRRIDALMPRPWEIR